MNRSHKIRLVPTKQQEVLLRKTAGTARYTYNWAKSEWEKMYKEYKDSGKTGPKPSAYTLSKRWTLERPEWSRETARGPQTQAILNLGKAYLNFWNGKAKHPTFKKKGSRDSFTVDNVKAVVLGRKVWLPNIGWIRMREELRFQGKILSYTVSHQAGEWYVSIQVELPEPVRTHNPSIVGVDVGIKALAVASDGTVCENPLKLHKKQKYLRRMQRKLQRQVKGSKRRNRTKLRISRTFLKITNVRNDRIHKFTATVAKNHGTAVIETLDIMEMKEEGAKHLRRHLQDTAMREVHRQLEYKMNTVLKAPKFFPSSKRCSSCGHVKESLPCDIRIYKCSCGLSLDRDLNAAINLKNTPWVTGLEHVDSSKGKTKRETVNLSES